LLVKIQPDATVCRYLFTAKSLYMFRVSQHPSSRVLKTVTAASGTGHNTGTDTSLQRGLIGTLNYDARNHELKFKLSTSVVISEMKNQTVTAAPGTGGCGYSF
jgi:hypothetical protein